MIVAIFIICGIIFFFVWDVIEGRPPNDLGFIVTSGPESERGNWTLKAKIFLGWIILSIIGVVILIFSS